MSPIDSKNFPDAPFPASYSAEFRVHFDPDIYGQIREHVQADTSHEVGGILVGLWKKDENGPYAMVTAMIRCDKAVGKEGEVTFTHETWNDIAREMDGPYVDLQIVGWYHSHPGFGVFLSERDLFIQEHFFSNPGQVALVIDPIGETEGVFFWKDDKIVPGEYFWVGQKMSLSREDNVDAAQHPKVKLNAGDVGSQPFADVPPPLLGNSWFSLLVIVTIGLGMFVLGGIMKPSDGLSHRQRLTEGALYDYCFTAGKRPGLEKALVQTRQDVYEARLEINKLLKGETAKDASGEKGDKEKAKQPKEAPVDPKRLAKLADYLAKAEEQLAEAQSVYCLSEKEKLAIIQLIGMNLQSTITTKPKAESKKQADAKKQPAKKPEKKTNEKP